MILFKDFIKQHLYTILITGLILIALCMSFCASISLARYIETGMSYPSSNVASYKLKLMKCQSENITINKKDSTNNIVTGEYAFTVYNYDNDSVSEVSFMYSIYLNVPSDVNSCLNGIRLKVLDDAYSETSENYSMTVSTTYTLNSVTYYVYVVDGSSFQFTAGNRKADKYAIELTIDCNKLTFGSNEDTSYKNFKNTNLQIFATQIL